MPRRASPRSPRPASSREHRAVIYEVSHRTRYRYSAPISISHHVLHLAPRTCEHQRCHAERPRGHPCARLLGRRYRLFRQSGHLPDRAGIAHRAVVPQPEPGRGERHPAAAAGHDRAVGDRGGAARRRPVGGRSRDPRAHLRIALHAREQRSRRLRRGLVRTGPAAVRCRPRSHQPHPPRLRLRARRHLGIDPGRPGVLRSAAASARTSRTSRSQRCARSASRCATSAATW